MLSDSSDDLLRRGGLALEPYTSPFFNPHIRGGNAIPLAAFSAQPNTLGLVAEDDGAPILGVPVFRDDFFHPHSSTKQIGDYEYATGWVKKPSGEIVYVDTGVIKEIIDEEDDSASVSGSTMPLPADIPAPPRPDPRSRTLQLLPDDDWYPRPHMVRALESPLLSCTTSGVNEDDDSTLSDFGIYAFHNAGPHIPLSPSSPRTSSTDQSPSKPRLPDPTLSPVSHAAASPPLVSSTWAPSVIPEWQILVSQNLEMLHCAAVEVAAFQQGIEGQGSDFHLLDCVHMCQRVKAAIVSTTSSLKGIYSNTNNKCIDQLLSLQRTVTRLRDLVHHLQPLRLDDKLSLSISKLEDHERKLLNLAAKLQCTKRQRVRHAHGQTAQAHVEFHQLRASGGTRATMDNNKRIPRVTRRPSMTGQGL
ncbi:hypothetical protein PC9H_008119 [Pleurotus ostreatus]|uniref:Uncharacterized protein n=1 Tax=Pleurotus ostreatus TaxID=5322 RepID=A0A8H6ZSB5_PLEOS|nr:uncharacterized protein PC9H_008119 [Pleurotus ostreatus]KAF7428887.1 hypothetical protein PC9H_008119 [Pleurotus ostreatus]KAJ8697131.1 hypothetical protein PTI98_006935 [Pleurotus ostreatus]